MATTNDELKSLVEKLKEAHGGNLVSVVLYGSAAVENGEGDISRWSGHAGDKNILVVLERVTPADLKLAHPIAQRWRALGNPLPLYFTREEIEDSSDVFPMEFIDMSRVRRVLAGSDPFDGLQVPTHNLRHQKVARALHPHVAQPAAACPPDERFAGELRRAVPPLFVDVWCGRALDKKECVIKLAETLGLDKSVFARIFNYTSDDVIPLEVETEETFAAYILQLQKVAEAVDQF
jgi:hypothetical protein